MSVGGPPRLDRGQTREVCEKQEKYFKGKVVTLTVQSLILYQYPVAENFKVKKHAYVREMGIHLHSTAIIYILAHVSTSP